MLEHSLDTNWESFEEGDYAVLKETGEEVRCAKRYEKSFRTNTHNGTFLFNDCKGFYKADSDFFTNFIFNEND